jgi:uncharacterized protein (TIGR03435 family)
MVNGRLAAVVPGMSDFAKHLSFVGQRIVVDDTGLEGPFEIELTFNPATFAALPLPPESTLPSMQDALRNDLGLTLHSESRKMPVLIITDVESPSDN